MTGPTCSPCPGEALGIGQIRNAEHRVSSQTSQRKSHCPSFLTMSWNLLRDAAYHSPGLALNNFRSSQTRSTSRQLHMDQQGPAGHPVNIPTRPVPTLTELSSNPSMGRSGLLVVFWALSTSLKANLTWSCPSVRSGS